MERDVAAVPPHDSAEKRLGQRSGGDAAAQDPSFEALEERIRAFKRLDAAVRENGDAAAESLRFLQVVGRENDRVSLGMKGADEVPKRFAEFDVDAGRRFVEHDERRFVDKGLRDENAALHAARERAHRRIGLVGESEPLEHFADPFVVLRDAPIARLKSERFPHGEKWVERDFLRDDPDGARREARRPCGVEAENFDRTRSGSRQAAEA